MHLLHKCALEGWDEALNGIVGAGQQTHGVWALAAVWLAFPVSKALIKELNKVLEMGID